jgi:hypothetical protein
MSINEMPTDELTRRLEVDARRLDQQTRPITIADIEARRMATTTWPVPRRTTRARASIALTLATAVSITAIVAWSASRSTHSGADGIHVTNPTPDNSTESANESVHPEPHQGPLMYLEPTHVPAGFKLVSALGPKLGVDDKGGSPEITAAQSWVRFDAAHDAATATLDIQWGPGARAVPNGHGSTDPLEGWRSQSVAVTIRGRSGLYSSTLGGVAWEEPPGQAVSVDCRKCSRDELVQIANSLVQRADGGFTWPAPHNGFAFVNEAPGMSSHGTNVRQLAYRGANGNGFMIAIADDTEQPPFSQLDFPNMNIVDVRNTQGIIGPTMNAPIGGPASVAFMFEPTLLVQWLEYPNVAVTVAGKNVSKTDLLAIANGLREIDADHWAQLGASAQG